MKDHQADYELMKEREAQPIEDDGDQSLTLSCGDGEAEVFFAEDAYVTAVCIGGVNLERVCFSGWQISAWEASIARHLKAQADEARDALREAA